MQISLNLAEELPSTLRAVALMLNSIASDRDGGKGVQVTVDKPTNMVVTATVSELPDNPGNAPDAPGASDQSQIPPPPPLTGATAQTDANGSSTELDANGLPWIAEIHSTSKNKNQDGTWRYIRGGDPEVRARVEARVRAEMAARSGVQQPGGEADGQDIPPPPPPLNTAPADDTPPPPPPLAQPQAEAPTAPVEMKEVFSRASKLPIDARNKALEAVGLATMAEFLKQVKEIPEIAGLLLEQVIKFEPAE